MLLEMIGSCCHCWFGGTTQCIPWLRPVLSTSYSRQSDGIIVSAQIQLYPRTTAVISELTNVVPASKYGTCNAVTRHLLLLARDRWSFLVLAGLYLTTTTHRVCFCCKGILHQDSSAMCMEMGRSAAVPDILPRKNYLGPNCTSSSGVRSSDHSDIYLHALHRRVRGILV